MERSNCCRTLNSLKPEQTEVLSRFVQKRFGKVGKFEYQLAEWMVKDPEQNHLILDQFLKNSNKHEVFSNRQMMFKKFRQTLDQLSRDFAKTYSREAGYNRFTPSSTTY